VVAAVVPFEVSMPAVAKAVAAMAAVMPEALWSGRRGQQRRRHWRQRSRRGHGGRAAAVSPG
jgi:hypothetical protein